MKAEGAHHTDEDPDRERELARGNPPAPQVPPDTSSHPSHEEAIGGKGAEDPEVLADEERYEKGPGW